MKILSTFQIKALDQETIHRQQISSLELMERAAHTVFVELTGLHSSRSVHFDILCGAGNNGGDGLVLARMLYEAGYGVDVYLLKQETYSSDNAANQKYLEALGIKIQFFEPRDKIVFGQDTVVIDALFGIGLSHSLDKEWSILFKSITESSATVISIDVPSGLFADRSNGKDTPVVQADITYTFQAPKMALLQPENAKYSGNVICLDIGLDQGTIDEMSSHLYYTTLADCQKIIPKTNRFAHKGTFGHVLVIGGSYGKIGAVVISSKAALRTGCGLVSVHTPSCGYSVIQTAFVEAMVLPCKDEKLLTDFPDQANGYSAIAIGPGMGTDDVTVTGFGNFLRNFQKSEEGGKSLVIDADALNILSANPSLLDYLPKNSVLTPHPKELSRLIGSWEDDFEKLNKVKDFANQYQVIVVVKGANTVIVLPNGNIHFNSTGNPGMATGGSGDVLTGVIASLIAQGFSSEQAAILGVFLHGKAGDHAARSIHPKSMIASDIIAYISSSWKEIHN